MRYTLINVSRECDGYVDGAWLQDFIGTFDDAVKAARDTERANHFHITIAVVEELSGTYFQLVKNVRRLDKPEPEKDYTSEVAKALEEAQKQWDAGCTTAYGEPQAMVELDNDRVIEIILEQEMLPEEDYFYSAHLHCSADEYDAGLYQETFGIITTYNSVSTRKEQLMMIIRLALKCNDEFPVGGDYDVR